MGLGRRKGARMTSRHENRRITERNSAGQRDLLTKDDIDQDLLILDRAGRLTISLERLLQRLRIPVVKAPEVGIFEGAGTVGLVPDPGSEVGNVLKDDGTWGAGGAGAPTGASYVVMALDATLAAERVLTAGTGISLVDGGPNGAVTINNTATAPQASIARLFAHMGA